MKLTTALAVLALAWLPALAQSPPQIFAVSSFNVQGGRLVDSMPQVVSGRPFDFTVRVSRGDLSACPRVWVKSETPGSFFKEAGILYKDANSLRFRAMVVPGEEGVYGVYLCYATQPAIGSPFNARYSIVSQATWDAADKQGAGGVSDAQRLEQEVQRAQANARNALRRVTALEKQVKELADVKTQAAALRAEVERLQAEVPRRATREEVAAVDARLRTTEADLRTQNARIQELNSQISQAMQGVQDARNQIDQTNANLGVMNQNVTRVSQATTTALKNTHEIGDKRRGSWIKFWSKVLNREDREELQRQIDALAALPSPYPPPNRTEQKK